MFRLVSRKVDPPKENDNFHMTNEIRALGGRGTVKDFDGVVKFLAMLEGKRKTFMHETGKVFSLEDSARVLTTILDIDTLGRIEDNGTSLEDYTELKKWVDEREVKLKSRGNRAAKDPNAMVYGVDERVQGLEDPGGRAQGLEDPGGRAQDPWHGSAPVDP